MGNNETTGHAGFPIDFTDHARERMGLRAVSEADVAHVIETGDVRRDGADDGGSPKFVAAGYAGGQTIEVVYAILKGMVTILRVYTVYTE